MAPAPRKKVVFDLSPEAPWREATMRIRAPSMATATSTPDLASAAKSSGDKSSALKSRYHRMIGHPLGNDEGSLPQNKIPHKSISAEATTPVAVPTVVERSTDSLNKEPRSPRRLIWFGQRYQFYNSSQTWVILRPTITNDTHNSIPITTAASIAQLTRLPHLPRRVTSLFFPTAAHNEAIGNIETRPLNLSLPHFPRDARPIFFPPNNDKKPATETIRPPHDPPILPRDAAAAAVVLHPTTNIVDDTIYSAPKLPNRHALAYSFQTPQHAPHIDTSPNHHHRLLTHPTQHQPHLNVRATLPSVFGLVVLVLGVVLLAVSLYKLCCPPNAFRRRQRTSRPRHPFRGDDDEEKAATAGAAAYTDADAVELLPCDMRRSVLGCEAVVGSSDGNNSGGQGVVLQQQYVTLSSGVAGVQGGVEHVDAGVYKGFLGSDVDERDSSGRVESGDWADGDEVR